LPQKPGERNCKGTFWIVMWQIYIFTPWLCGS
jgi:hypothetical protein